MNYKIYEHIVNRVRKSVRKGDSKRSKSINGLPANLTVNPLNGINNQISISTESVCDNEV